MKKTGFLLHNKYMEHDTGPGHPESAARLSAIYKGIKKGDLLSKLTMIKALPADMRFIEAVHTKAYIERFKAVCASGEAFFDYPDNQLCRQTFEIAQLAAGGVIEATKMVLQAKIDNAFCAVRPPGHHAESERALGFCYFNNVAIAARYLQLEWGIKRVGIIDIDVHHGNGTQKIFESDESVYYFSIHEHPSFAFPGTGREFEQGAGKGQGYTDNAPILPGNGDEDYRQSLSKQLIPAIDRFHPEVLLVSTGFDAHEEDAMSGIMLTTEGYSWIMRKIVQIADTYCNGRLISVLEGGYCLKRMPELAANHVEILLEGGI